MLAFACPSCRQRADWPDDWRGEKVDCPFCGKCMELTELAGRDEPREERRADRLEVVRRRDRDRDEEEDDRGGRRRARRREVTCPDCGCRDVPIISKEMAENAWIFIVVGIFFWPLIILAILMKDTWEVCPDCRRKLKKVAGPTFGA